VKGSRNVASPLSAAGAYAAIARLATGPAQAAALPMPGAEKADTDFTSVLKQAIGSVEDIGKKSDTQTRAMVNGKSNMVDVVTAVSETEVAIDAVVAVRDKIIQAYEDIMKMPI
jgi:flagellar hook-basal body complex protein FliE